MKNSKQSTQQPLLSPPKKPRKPTAPIEPRSTIWRSKSFDAYDGISVREILTELENHSMSMDSTLDLSYYTDDWGGRDTSIIFREGAAVPNPNYEEEMKEYERLLSKYKKDLTLYEERLKNYPKELEQHQYLQEKIDSFIKELKSSDNGE